MKKLLFSSLFILFMNVCAMAWDPIPFTVSFDDDQPGGNGHPKTPITAPKVYINDYMLLFEANHPEYVLYIKDEDEVVVYSTVVTSATTEVVLPATLSGDYEIELIMGDWLFSGWINLN
jgi:hypothetical protein